MDAFSHMVKRIWPTIPERERGRFAAQVCFHNVTRMRAMAWVAVVVMAGLLTVQSLVPDGHALSKGYGDFLILRGALVAICLGFLWAAPRPVAPAGIRLRHRVAVPAGVAALCLLSGVWVGVAQQWAPVVTFYLVMVFTLAALVNLSPVVSGLSLFGGLAAFWACVAYFQHDNMVLTYHLLNGTVLTILAFTVGQLNRLSSILRYQDQLTIERQAAELEALSLKDELTGLANRRELERKLAEEWYRGGRHGRPLSAIMIDIDRFKAYNDTYGHAAGDECLRRVAGAIGSRARRGGDLAVRYGGEEFLVLLPETGRLEVERFAQLLAQEIWDLDLPHQASEHGRVTASLGLATTQCRPGQNPHLLVQAADRALYQAKESGRNRLVVDQTGLLA